MCVSWASAFSSVGWGRAATLAPQGNGENQGDRFGYRSNTGSGQPHQHHLPCSLLSRLRLLGDALPKSRARRRHPHPAPTTQQVSPSVLPLEPILPHPSGLSLWSPSPCSPSVSPQPRARGMVPALHSMAPPGPLWVLSVPLRVAASAQLLSIPQPEPRDPL